MDVELIGPFTENTPKVKFDLRAITMIDPATRWLEVADVASPSAKGAMEAFNDAWLTRYPRQYFLGLTADPSTSTSSTK